MARLKSLMDSTKRDKITLTVAPQSKEELEKESAMWKKVAEQL